MSDVLTAIKTLFPTSPLLSEKGDFVVDETLGVGLLFAADFSRNKQKRAIIASNLYGAQRLYEFLANFLDEDDLIFFPGDELLRAETLVSSKEFLVQRLFGMQQSLEDKPRILITHPSALLRYLPSPERYVEKTLKLVKGEEYDLTDLKETLVELGYERVERVVAPLQFAARGDIIDVFSVSSTSPARIEFFGDQIDAIRIFGLGDQRSYTEADEYTVLPATDIFVSEDELTQLALTTDRLLKEDEELHSPALMEDERAFVSSELQRYITHDYKPSLYRYFTLLFDRPFSILDYFRPSEVFIANKNQYRQTVNMLRSEADEYLAELHERGRVVSGLHQYMESHQAIKKGPSLHYGVHFVATGDETVFTVHKAAVNSGGFNGIVTHIRTYLSTNEKTVLCLSDKHKWNSVVELLRENDIPFEEVSGFDLPKEALGISSTYLNEGFEIPSLKTAFLSENDIFGRKNVAARFANRFKNATVLHSFEDLKPGDYVVHEYNGIGQFAGIETLLVEGNHRDFLHILYADKQALYVPLEQFRLVRKYAGREGAAPKLSHLYGGDWEKKKKQIQNRVNELADRLIALYGARAKGTGFAFPPDDELQRQFENEFMYELTSDQAKALDDIKSDMQKPDIMDRLLCGDVGFGKTEVAFRAAFKAICAGKQVALLCPTTLLARQHYEVAKERFQSFGVRLGILSRMVPARDQRETIRLAKEGKVDLVIGTHRLLSKEVSFKDLGLLIVDEEQRFGVEQKERIKELKSSVDVLTLSATPIPRTLQMSLIGVRALSEINTAPMSRVPIQTYVVPQSEEVIDELIARELGRGGQVFYLHNNIDSIYAVASKLGNRVPMANIGVAHGRMSKEEVEDVMSRFYDGDINVLVCTSIVENGIDVPNANMIIVEDADHFGLSQLYQIKGRVGRGNRIAYAYLLYRPHKEMNEDAQKRLKAISEFTELGSGYKIAQRDLMIRGAGDILGPEQAGFIDSVGLDLYLKLLNEAIQSKKQEQPIAPPEPRKMFDLDAFIPSSYASDADKLELYQELDALRSEKELEGYRKKVRDIYGRVPEEVAALIEKKRVDLQAENEEIEEIEEIGNRIDITIAQCFSRINGIGNELFDSLSDYLGIIRVAFIERKLKIMLTKREHWLRDLLSILKIVHKVYENRTATSQS